MTMAKALPSTIRELVQIRLDELGPARKTACLAAVIGIGFKRSWLEAVALAQGTDATQLEALLQTDLLQQEGGNLKFSHALLRDAVITLLPARQFRELARTVAQTLTTQFAAGFEHEPERAAHWFTKPRIGRQPCCGAARLPVWRCATSLSRSAAPFASRAGDAAADRTANAARRLGT